jgi:dolichyl-phosphate-mannose--protein O-mannosyl transferase
MQWKRSLDSLNNLLFILKEHFLLGAILSLGVVLRFYGLGLIPGPIFDEVFYPIFALNYLNGETFFAVHPPLGSYLISLGIYLYQLLPWTDSIMFGSVNIEDINPFSYRWISALSSVILIYIGYKISLELMNKKGFALLVALFLTLDGSLLVDSRIGVINSLFSLFGFMSMLFFIKALKKNKMSYFFLTGLLLGSAFSVKWNGLGFWLSMIILVVLFFILSKFIDNFESSKQNRINLNPLNFLFVFLVPFLFYLAIWLPDLLHNNSNLIDQHAQMISYHFDSGDQKPHPYSSPWYTWPLMIRPMGYFFESNTILGPDLVDKEIFTAIHLLPNPALSLFSFIAIVILTFKWMGFVSESIGRQKILDELYISSFILVGYYANFLPWAFPERSTFIYHYQPSAVFSFMALAYLLHEAVKKDKTESRMLYMATLALILISAIYWLPLHLGLPISSESFYSKMWFISWI